MKNIYYDGTKLLSLKDQNGLTPSIYISTSNRSAGKTTFFSRYLVNRWKRHGEKFILLYRFNYELADVPDKFFKEIRALFFPGYEMTSKSRAKGLFYELYINEKLCGFAISLNAADPLKKYSHLFSDCARILFDEFQSENDHYCPNEIQKFLSVLTSIARGGGEQVRYIQVIMLSNLVSLLNPYYVALGVSDKLDNKTKFIRGDGFVMEQGFLDSVAEKQKQSGIFRAFAGNDYNKYTTEKIYLNDNYTFIENMTGKNNYLVTFKIGGASYAIREYPEKGIIYCDQRIDETFPVRLVIDADDMDVNYITVKNNSYLLSNLKWFFEHGSFRFKNLACKNAVFKLLSLS